MIGFFVNTLVIKCDLSPNLTFQELLLERVRVVCLGAFEHQEMPFDKLVEILNPTRDSNSNALFQVFFNFQNQLPSEYGFHAQRKSSDFQIEFGAKYELTLHTTAVF